MISKLEGRPALITNFIQYTPPPLILNFIDQKNIEKNDIVFDSWQKKPSKEYEESLTRVYV
jgi:predicted metal-dependent hydrolase